MLTYTFSLKEMPSELLPAIERELIPQIDRLFDNAAPKLQKGVSRIIERAVRSQPEWYSIARGQLRQQFGLPNSLRNIQNILSIWLASIEVKHKKIKRRGRGEFSGGIYINAIRSGYRDILSASDAVFITEKGDRLEWVKWLLTEGTSTIITDYMLGRGRGRAGSFIMIKGSGWGVPPEYAGTKDDNMITRAIKQAEPDIMRELEKIIVQTDRIFA